MNVLVAFAMLMAMAIAYAAPGPKTYLVETADKVIFLGP